LSPTAIGAISRTLCFTKEKKKKTSRKKHAQTEPGANKTIERDRERESARETDRSSESDGVLGSNRSSVVRQHPICVRGQRSGQFEIVGS